MIQNLRTDPGGTIITLLYVAVCILFSLIIHECAHGYVALKCGDPTAKMMGRLTLDPRKHLDPLGTVCMIFLRVGWAKPVPINPRNFRYYRRDYILVSLAGIITNLMMCVLSLVLAALLSKIIYQSNLIEYARKTGLQNNLLDSYHFLYPSAISNGVFSVVPVNEGYEWTVYLQRLFLMLSEINLALAIFNLIPVPPLDGYRFLDMFVFRGKLAMDPGTINMIQIGFMVILLSGVLTGFLGTANKAVFGLLCNLISIII